MIGGTTQKLGGALLLAISLASLAKSDGAPTEAGAPVLTHKGMCDASAAVMLDDETFVVADDELNILAIYDAGRGGGPVQSVKWEQLFEQEQVEQEQDSRKKEKKKPDEADIEGAARIGNQIYWIASHGRNKKGKWKSDRHQFFAIEVTSGEGAFRFTPVGRYHDLAVDMVESPALRGLALHEVVMADSKKVKELAPKEEGLNIEGLAAAPDGQTLLIALRNPRVDGGAILMQLLNPADVLQQDQKPRFGEPIILDLSTTLGGKRLPLSIRSIEYSRKSGSYLIIGGPHDDRKSFAMFSWSGDRDDPPVLLEAATQAIRAISGFAPEAIVEYPLTGKVQLLSDDGTMLVRVDSPKECEKGAYKDGVCEGKSLLDPSRRTFRSTTVTME